MGRDVFYNHQANPGYMTTTPGDSCNDCGEEDAMFFDPYNVTLECSYCGEVHCL